MQDARISAAATAYNRRSIRLRDYDYSRAGVYFVTICAKDRQCLFGELVDGAMQLNDCGQIVAESWRWLSEQYTYVCLDEWVVMPNHFHGLITIMDRERRPSQGTPQTGSDLQSELPRPVKRKPLGQLVGAFKTVSTKRINELRCAPGALVWQRNYYEHVVRDEHSLDRIREYIVHNPLSWESDQLHPLNKSKW